MRFSNLHDWLSWQETLNPVEIDLGLERVSTVLIRAGLSSSFKCPLITVAGTNGKGSVVAMLEAIALAAGLKVCSYTSPHIFHYNERIKINAKPVDDDVLCEAFERIDQARSDVSLTYFEFGTLAAVEIFFREQPDLVILEVGLGGRLDAVNLMDADVSVLTSIAIDHVDWLGDDRESIGYEKAGVARHGRPLICGDSKPPASVINVANQQQCELIQIGRDYEAVITVNDDENLCDTWTLRSLYGDVIDLPKLSLQGVFQKSNAATAIVALQALQEQGLLLTDLKANPEQFNRVIASGLSHINLPGRFQQLNVAPQVFTDVAHNLQAAESLAAQIKALPSVEKNKTWAIVAMLEDKDVSGVLKAVSAEIDCWCFAGLENINRGLDVETLAELGREKLMNQCTIQADTVVEACELVLLKASEDDRIIIFGSFHTVAEAMQFFVQSDNDDHV